MHQDFSPSAPLSEGAHQQVTFLRRLAAAKKKYDPAGIFFVHNGVGSEQWNADGFTKL